MSKLATDTVQGTGEDCWPHSWCIRLFVKLKGLKGFHFRKSVRGPRWSKCTLLDIRLGRLWETSEAWTKGCHCRVVHLGNSPWWNRRNWNAGTLKYDRKRNAAINMDYTELLRIGIPMSHESHEFFLGGFLSTPPCIFHQREDC